MRSFDLRIRRLVGTLATIAGVSVLSTCDLGKILNVDPTKAFTFDSTKLTLTGASEVTLGGTATIGATSSADLSQVIKRYSSDSPATITVDSVSGLMTGIAIGTAKITARVLAPELGSGVTSSRGVRVRYKGIKITAPVATDSIQGLGIAQNRTATVFGANNANASVATVTLDSLRSRDTTIFRVSGTTISARKNGTTQLVAFFDGFRDSMAVRVRQVAKSITYPTTDYTARHLNFNLSVPLTAKDVTDSLIPTPTFTWRTKDTTKATVGAATGVLRVKSVTTDSVWAKIDTVERGQKIVVAQVVGSLTKFAGDARTDTVAKNVTVIPTVTVVDSGLTPIAGAPVTFRPVLGASANASVQDSAQISDVNGHAKPTNWKLSDVAGAQSLLAFSGSATGPATTTFTATAVAGPARKLAFTVQPTTGAIGAAIAPAIKVAVLDSLGNAVTTATNSVTLTLGNNPGAANLGGTLTVAAVGGVATFNNVTVSASGSGYTLQANSGTLSNATSNGFDSFGAPAKLAFVTQPSNVRTVLVMSPAVRVAIQDASGMTVPTATNTVTLSISINPSGATLGGTVSVAAVVGIATFPNLTLDQTGSGYILAASATGLAQANSSSFTVQAAGPASKLAFTVQPSDVVAGATMAPAIQVAVQDASGVTVTSSTTPIALAIDLTANPGSSSISGGSTVTAVASGGVATFGTVSINKTGAGYKLIASATSLTGATSNTFNVTPGPATQLVLATSAAGAVAGAAFTTQPVVASRDAAGNTRTSDNSTVVTMTVSSGATVVGATTATASSGVATFTTVGISGVAGTSYTLTFAATGLTSATQSITPPTSSWTARASMPTARVSLGVGVVNGMLVAVGGGTTPTVATATAEAYDPVAGTWSTKSSMPTARTSVCAGVVNGLLYVGGGEPGVATTRTTALEAYDLLANSWTTRAPMPAPLAGHGCAGVNGILYSVGGILSSGTAVNSVYAYDPSSNSWTSKAPMPTARYALTVAVVNGIVYAIGGNANGGAAISVVEAYDPVSNTWTSKTPLPSSRSAAAAVELNGLVYVVGGNTANCSASVATGTRYDPGSNSWTTIPALSTARSTHGMVAIGGGLVAVGGFSSGCAVLAGVEAYFP